MGGPARKKTKMKHTKIDDSRLPVTLLSGFLGSGKTTLLQNILQNKQGLKVAIIVNDMAELNIDAALVSSSGLVQRQEELVRMQNGCICCTLREDLLQEVARLAGRKEFDYLVIESTGISEPMQVAETFTFQLHDHGHDHGHGRVPDEQAAPDQQACETGSCGPSLMDVARLDTCITVVDAAAFFANVESIEDLRDRHGSEVDPEDERNISELLVEQIEFADVVILNKCDLVSAAQRRRIAGLVASLNPAARVLQTTNSKVDLRHVVNTGLFSLEKASQAPGWLKAMRGEAPAHVPETLEYGISSFVYRARRPFHPGRLYHSFLTKYFLTKVVEVEVEEGSEEAEDVEEGSRSNSEGSEDASADDKSDDGSSDGGEDGGGDDDKEGLQHYAQSAAACLEATKRDLGGLLRSKGSMWLATQQDRCVGWSHAGVVLQVRRDMPWFATVPKEEWPEDPAVAAQIQADFCDDPAVGDRRQELVFIGQELKVERIKALLDECLATEEELLAAGVGAVVLEDPMFDEADGGEE